MKKIQVFTTGGTIAMRAEENGVQLPDSLIVGDAVQAALPDIEISVCHLFSKSSANINLSDIDCIVRSSLRAAAYNSGIVISHGTDTLEETCFALEVLTRLEAPIVVTGAMRSPNQPGFDGEANLIASCRVAASEESRGLVLAVLDEEIHWGGLVRKTHSFRTHAFSSEPFGPIGWVCEGNVRFALRPTKRVPPLRWGEREPNVPILEVGSGFDPRILKVFSECDGLVLSLPGGGHISAVATKYIEDLRIPIVFATRTGAGGTLKATYAYPGGEIDLLQRGLISAEWLDARKARLALALMCSSGMPLEQIRDYFNSLRQ